MPVPPKHEFLSVNDGIYGGSIRNHALKTIMSSGTVKSRDDIFKVTLANGIIAYVPHVRNIVRYLVMIVISMPVFWDIVTAEQLHKRSAMQMSRSVELATGIVNNFTGIVVVGLRRELLHLDRQLRSQP